MCEINCSGLLSAAELEPQSLIRGLLSSIHPALRIYSLSNEGQSIVGHEEATTPADDVQSWRGAFYGSVTEILFPHGFSRHDKGHTEQNAISMSRYLNM